MSSGLLSFSNETHRPVFFLAGMFNIFGSIAFVAFTLVALIEARRAQRALPPP
jgi:hypothetical protein